MHGTGFKKQLVIVLLHEHYRGECPSYEYKEVLPQLFNLVHNVNRILAKSSDHVPSVVLEEFER